MFQSKASLLARESLYVKFDPLVGASVNAATQNSDQKQAQVDQANKDLANIEVSI